ncbi:MAG: malto-oligosyltrehalose trehalohydrolase [Nitrospirota bacterium]|jgi:maltooligosyltrehalose trehalohydrolase
MREYLGANHLGGGDFSFLLWALRRENVSLKVLGPSARTIPMERLKRGYFQARLEGLGAGARYVFVLDGEVERPDPASFFQPGGVHGPSETYAQDAFAWTDRDWKGMPLEDYLIYELHVGTFAPQGTFDGVIERIPYLKDLGVTALELMPVAQFPGPRNWGYDGAYPFAVQDSYGGPDGLKRLVDACHREGLAVVMDVVYNHMGPEGNYLRDFGPYFTDHYRTPWGDAVNFDGPYSDPVRRFFIESALNWLENYHMDALRIDAVHGIYDFGAKHFLAQLRETVEARGLDRHVHLMAESDLNDVRVIDGPERGGYGIHAQWNDDFHHALHALLTGEDRGYYIDFGRPEHLEKALREGFVYSGQYSEFRKRRHGNSSAHIHPRRFVVFSQNHDQVGNRMRGDRLAEHLTLEQLKLVAALVVLSPSVPLLFMGEEYGEDAPFQYFISHADPSLIHAVREGRRREFASFQWSGEVPDPQDEATFERSRVNPEKRNAGRHKELYEFYRGAIALRKSLDALESPGREDIAVSCSPGLLFLAIRHRGEHLISVANLGDRPVETALPSGGLWERGEGRWEMLVDSASPGGGLRRAGPVSARLDGPLAVAPYGFLLYRRPL